MVWEDKMRNKWLGVKLQTVYINIGNERKIRRIVCTWTPLPNKQAKLNFGGASQGCWNL